MKDFIFTKVKSITLVTIIILIFTMIMPVTFGTTYSDLSPTHWCYEKIMDFTDKGYITGYDDGTFRPDLTVTRAEFVKIVNNFFDYSGSNSNVTFTDVSAGDWFEPYIKEAVARGYIKGYSDGTFRPNTPIKRQDVIVILARILGIDDEEYSINNKDGLIQYKDRNLVEDWAYKAVQSYTVHGFVEGNGEDVIRVLENITRAETVGFLNVVEKKVEIKRSGGSSRPTAIAPVITVYGSNGETEIQIPEEQEWVGYDDATNEIEEFDLAPNDALQSIYDSSVAPLSISDSEQEENNETLGAYVEMSPSDELSSIYKTVDDSGEMLYDGRFFLIDGIYDLTAYATKPGYRNSALTARTVRIDTKAPQVFGEQVGELCVAHEQKVNIQVFDPENNGEESKIDTTKLLYKWVRFGGPCTSDWQTLSIDESGYAELTAPSEYGRYILAVSAYDNAGNHYGCFRDEINHNEVTIQIEEEEDDDDNVIHYGFVKQNGECFRFLEVIVGNNNPSTVEDSAVVGMNGEVLIDVLSNDYDLDGDTLEVYSVDNGCLGTTEIDESGKILYTPNRNARGTDSFYYTVSDGNEGYTSGIVNIQIYGLDVIINEESVKGFDVTSSEEDIVENGLRIFVGGRKSLQVSSTLDLLIEEIIWENSNKRVVELNENGCDANVIGRKTGKATLTITANLSNDITAVCYIDVQVIPTKVTIYHIYDDEDYSTSPTEVTDKRVDDVVTVLDYADTINDYYTATADPETITVTDDSHEATINYTRNIANVKFVDWDSVVIDEQSVPYGEDARAPEEPKREGYEFVGWSEDFTEVESDLRIVAEYAKDDFTAPIITITGEPLFIDGTASLNSDWGYDWNITVTAIDDNDDVKALRYVWNQNADAPDDISSAPNEITSGTVIEKPNVIDTGVYYLHVYAKDFFGNDDTQTRAFNVDRTVPNEPEVSIRTTGSGLSTKYYLTINTDDDYSGVYTVQYRLKNWPSSNFGDTTNYSGEFRVDRFLQAIKISVTDNVGNNTEYEISEENFNAGSTLMTLSEPVVLNAMLSVPTEEDSNIENQQENVQEDLGEVILPEDGDNEAEQSTENDDNITIEEELNVENGDNNIIEGENNMYNENYDEENDNLDINNADSEDSDNELADVDNEDLEDELNDMEDEESDDEENDEEYSDTEDEENDFDENEMDEESQEDNE